MGDDAIAADRMAPGAHARCTRGLPYGSRLVARRRSTGVGQRDIVFARADGARARRIIAARRHLERAARHPHGVRGLLRGDQPKPHLLCRAKKAVVDSRRRCNAMNDRRDHAARATIADERKRQGSDLGSMERGENRSVRSVGPLTAFRRRSFMWSGLEAASRRRLAGASSRALTVGEREEISRGLATGVSFRQLGVQLGRPTSTVSREVGRHGGRRGYRAAVADADHVGPGAPASTLSTRPASRLVRACGREARRGLVAAADRGLAQADVS